MNLKVASILGLMSVTTFAIAGFKGPGSEDPIVNVESALTMSDDRAVTLQGKLIRKLEEEHFTFRDASGDIEVEIDDDLLRDQIITPEDEIRISGEIDVDKNLISVDVDSLVIIS